MSTLLLLCWFLDNKRFSWILCLRNCSVCFSISPEQLRVGIQKLFVRSGRNKKLALAIAWIWSRIGLHITYLAVLWQGRLMILLAGNHLQSWSQWSMTMELMMIRVMMIDHDDDDHVDNDDSDFRCMIMMTSNIILSFMMEIMIIIKIYLMVIFMMMMIMSIMMIVILGAWYRWLRTSFYHSWWK